MCEKIKRSIVVLLAMLAVVASLGASGKTEATPQGPTASPNKLSPIDLNIYIFGNDANRMQQICDEFYKRTQDALNTKLHFYFQPGWDEYTNKINVALAAGEQIDALFDAPWYNMGTRISKNIYMNLDGYFNNDKYPGLKKAFSVDYVESNKFKDPSNETHVYGIPLMQAPASPKGIVYRADLAKKYGIDQVSSFDELYKLYDAILANEKGVVPLAASHGWSYLFTSTINPVKAPKISQWYDQYVLLNPDGRSARAIVDGFTPQQAKECGIPDWYNSIYTTVRSWYVKGYVKKDVVNEKDEAGLFKSGGAASIFTDTTNAYSMLLALRAHTPEADLGIFILNPDIAGMKPHSINTDYKAWNFQCIPSTSRNADRTMMVFDWIFASRSNNDLFQFGIEGQDFIPVGDDQYKVPSGVDASALYNLPSYDLSMNPNFVRVPVDFPKQFLPLQRYLQAGSTYVKSVAAGFSFNQEPVKDYIAAIATVKDAEMISDGMIEDWLDAAQKAQEKKDKLGYAKVMAEELKQYNEYAATLK